MTELPSHWSSVPVGELCGPVEKVDPVSLGRNHFLYVDIGALEPSSSSLENVVQIPTLNAPTRARQLIRNGDSIFATVRPYMKKVAYIPEEFDGEIASTGFCVLRPIQEKLQSKFLFYFLLSDQLLDQVLPLQRGVSYPAIRDNDLKNAFIPVPPIEEQNKIVELLEDHLTRLDAALTDVKRAKSMAAQFRRSFIHDMTTSIEGSEVMGILDICDVYQPKTISTKELILDGEFPVYGANGQIGFYDKFNHAESEVTVTCRGATCGTVNVIPAMSWITGNAMVFRPKDSRIQKGFLEYVLRGMDWTPVITGTAQPQITRTSIQDVFVKVPSPDVQNELYMRLESSLTQVTNAALLSEKVEMQAASLRRSLLQAAFSGQLTKEVASV